MLSLFDLPRQADFFVAAKQRNGAYVLEITDDGVGLPDSRHVGVGLHSMRERAEELGGTFVIEAAPGGGTRIYACLPYITPAL